MKIYNSDEPPLTKNNARTLRILLNDELVNFGKPIKKYMKETNVIIKKKLFDKIKQLIQRDVQFAAFKRQIIRDNNLLYIDFKEAL